jgi:hypothetical protein
MKKHKPIRRRMMKAMTETVMAIAEDGRLLAEDGRMTPSVEWGAGFEVLVKGELSKVKENNENEKEERK